MIKDDEVGSEGFALLTDCARDDVLQRQVSVIDEKSVISRKQDEEEGEQRGDYLPHVEFDVVSRTSSRSSVWCISTDLNCGELGGTKGDGHGRLDNIHLNATQRDCSSTPNLVHILHLCIY